MGVRLKRTGIFSERETSGWPSSGPCTTKAVGRRRQPCSATGESGPGVAPLFPCFPTRYRLPSSASEDLATQGVPRRRRIAGRGESPWPGPAFPESRSPERCDRSQRARCSSEEVQCVSRCRPEKAFSFHAKDEYVLRLSWRVLLHGLLPPARANLNGARETAGG